MFHSSLPPFFLDRADSGIALLVFWGVRRGGAVSVERGRSCCVNLDASVRRIFVKDRSMYSKEPAVDFEHQLVDVLTGVSLVFLVVFLCV